MKKDFLLYSALLSAIAAQGADFDRAKLDKMLDDLDRSQPSTNFSPGATCYVPIMPQKRRAEYICPTCGERTFYPYRENLDFLYHARQKTEKLRKLGIDIRLNEKPFCHKCSKGEKIFTPGAFPVYGTVANIPELNKRYPKLEVGFRIPIVEESEYSFEVDLTGHFVHKDLIGEDGILLKNAHIRTGPGTDFLSSGVQEAGTKLVRLLASNNIPADWVKVKLKPEDSCLSSFKIPKKLLTQVVNDKSAMSTADKLHEIASSWIIVMDGKIRELSVKDYDLELLEAFLTGKESYKGDRGSVYVVKNSLPRLKELLEK